MAGKTSRANKKAKKNAGQKERKANCKKNDRQMDGIKVNIMEDDGIIKEGSEEGSKPSVAVMPPTPAEIAYCKQMGNPDFRQLGDQEMSHDILGWRMSIVGRYRKD